ncbi:MAG: HAD-IIB family hydrolase [Nitrospirota bacterium]
MKHPVIFTDLDGTLLDARSYSFERAVPALTLLRQRNIPLVICSSKTRREIEHYRELLYNDHPFIAENGGGVFIPRYYFTPETLAISPPPEESGPYLLLRLGASYRDLRRAIGELRAGGFALRGFGDMTAAEVAALTGLTAGEAAMAQEREFDEPFVAEGPLDEEALNRAVASKGLSTTKGAFFHLLGKSDKGKAVALLGALYARQYGQLFTVALGDSPNDLPMLERVDCPVVVRKPDGSYDSRIAVPGLLRAEGAGPEGWNRAVMSILESLDIRN